MSTAKQECEIIENLSQDMYIKLRQNSNRSWNKNTSVDSLLCALRREVDELEHAIGRGVEKEIRMECADVANFVAIIADCVRRSK